MTQQELKEYIIARIYPNNAQEITGEALQSVLLEIVENAENKEEALATIEEIRQEIATKANKSVVDDLEQKKVDKIEGKGLSTNDYSNVDKALVDSIPTLTTDVDNIGQTLADVEYEINKKADTEGYYPNMSVGMADNLVGRGDVQDAQINFRPSGGVLGVGNGMNITDGAARIERIKGNSVVWNQLVASDSTSVELSANHKYFTDINGEQNIRIISSTTIIEVVFGRDRVIDLTKMFSAGNEPTTVEEYHQRKPMNIEDEFAYNAGTLVDMKVDSLISTSDNAYDYTKGYARVMGGHTYDCSYGTAFVEKVYFSTDKDNIVAEENAMTSENGKYTFPSDGYAVPYTTDGDVREYCVCLQHSYTKPHPPYQQEVKDLSFISEAFPDGMRSAGSAYDEIRFNPTKKVWEAVKRIGEVDLGSLEWRIYSTSQSGVYSWIAPLGDAMVYANNRKANILGNGFGTKSADDIYMLKGDKTIGLAYNATLQTNRVNIYDSQYTTNAQKQDFMNSLDNKVCYYELAEPIVEEIEGSENWNLDYLVWDFGSEEAIVPNNVPSAPFRADINYEPNAVDDLRWAISKIRSLRAELAQLQSAQASETNLTEV